jgi:hypothetical protein
MICTHLYPPPPPPPHQNNRKKAKKSLFSQRAKVSPIQARSQPRVARLVINSGQTTGFGCQGQYSHKLFMEDIL